MEMSNHPYVRKMSELEAEIERLRAALQKISTSTGGAAVPIARAALRADEQTQG